MDAEEIIESVLNKYSSPTGDETHCSKSELKRDLIHIIESFERERNDIQQVHEAYLRCARWNAEANKPLLQRLFNK